MEWHYSKNGQQHGPVNEAELIAMVQNGSVAPTDLAWNKGMDGWKPIREITALNAQAASPAPSMTSPPIQTAPSQAPKRLTQEQKAQIHWLKEQMKQKYERFVKETHIRAQMKSLRDMKFGLVKKRPVLDGDGLRQERTDKIYKSWSQEGGSVYDYPENPDEVFYFEDGLIKDAKHLITYRINFHVKIHDRNKVEWYEEQAESFVKAEQKGKYAPDFPSYDEFMEWRWRDMDSKGELEDGLIEAMKLCD